MTVGVVAELEPVDVDHGEHEGPALLPAFLRKAVEGETVADPGLKVDARCAGKRRLLRLLMRNHAVEGARQVGHVVDPQIVVPARHTAGGPGEMREIRLNGLERRRVRIAADRRLRERHPAGGELCGESRRLAQALREHPEPFGDAGILSAERIRIVLQVEGSGDQSVERTFDRRPAFGSSAGVTHERHSP